MKWKWIGSKWGGWSIDETKIRENSHVLSLGIGPDCTFDVELLTLFPSLTVVGVDPTEVAARAWMFAVHNDKSLLTRFLFMPKAAYGESTKVALGNPATTVFVDQSGASYDTVTLPELFRDFPDTCLLKMDIEGSEYSILENLDELSVDQFVIEWHHWLDESPKTLDDTKAMIDKVKSWGYTEVKQSCNEAYRVIQESVFIRSDLL